jgi:elongation factor Ts
MATITTADIQALRQQTGVGMMEAKKALVAANGDAQLAIDNLRKAGMKMAAAKSERTVKEGVVGTYLHANGKVAALVAVACETDFVARTKDFQDLAHDLAVHVAAANPQYLQPSDVPADVVAKEREIYQQQLKTEGKPEKMWDNIIEGKLKKFYADTCLLNQTYVKDDSLTITELVQQGVAKLGENIQVVSFSRLAI